VRLSPLVVACSVVAGAVLARDTSPASEVLTLPGLQAPGRIVTDRFGIPHLRAASAGDLYFLWGFVTARDRLWQLEISRRASQGRQWEWFGNRALRADGGAQLFELRQRAARIWQRERRDPAVRRPLERYADGVNAYLNLCRSGARPWPAELQRLGRQPEDWRPEDSVLLLLGQAVVLDLVLPELEEADEIARHGADWVERRRRHESEWTYSTIPDSAARRLYGPGSRLGALPRAPADAARLEPALLEQARRAVAGWRSPLDLLPDQRASNVFAVGPGRSASGRAMLANDPHQALTSPGPFHVVHLFLEGGMDAAGAFVPGLPVIVSGRNRRCAWGVSSLAADVVDVYADTLSRDGRRVRWSGRWVPIRQEPYAMRFRAFGGFSLPPFGQKRRYTPHGPVVAFDTRRRLALSVRWAGRDEDVTLRRMLGLEASSSATEVAARFRTLVKPTLNLIAADVEGAVVYQAAGALPRRGFRPRLGVLPGDGRHEWRGEIARERLPAWQAPHDGFLVNANNLPVGAPYPEPLPRYDWSHDRAVRMAQRLQGDPRITMDDLRSIQNDVFSRGAERFVPRLLACVDSLGMPDTGRVRAALDTLRAWDFTARRTRVAPTLFRAWYGALLRRSRLEGLQGLAAAALEGRAPEALRAPGTESPERPAQAARAALDLALDELGKRLGPELPRWLYGRAHRARFAHALSWRHPDLEPVPVAVDGDNSTPCVGASRLPWSVHVTHGAAWRHLVDLADRERSLCVIPPGNAAGAHRGDHLNRWANHAYVPLHLDWSRIATVSEEDLELAPGRR
jgi:penicillin G amidase